MYLVLRDQQVIYNLRLYHKIYIEKHTYPSGKPDYSLNGRLASTDEKHELVRCVSEEDATTLFIMLFKAMADGETMLET